MRIEFIVHSSSIFEAIWIKHTHIKWDVHEIALVGILKCSMINKLLLTSNLGWRVFRKRKSLELPIFDALSKIQNPKLKKI